MIDYEFSSSNCLPVPSSDDQWPNTLAQDYRFTRGEAQVSVSWLHNQSQPPPPFQTSIPSSQSLKDQILKKNSTSTSGAGATRIPFRMGAVLETAERVRR